MLVGFIDGDVDFVGLSVGLSEGPLLIVGETEGDGEGWAVGFDDGCALGEVEGDDVGITEGVVVGSTEGVEDG